MCIANYEIKKEKFGDMECVSIIMSDKDGIRARIPLPVKDLTGNEFAKNMAYAILEELES